MIRLADMAADETPAEVSCEARAIIDMCRAMATFPLDMDDEILPVEEAAARSAFVTIADAIENGVHIMYAAAPE